MQTLASFDKQECVTPTILRKKDIHKQLLLSNFKKANKKTKNKKKRVGEEINDQIIKERIQIEQLKNLQRKLQETQSCNINLGIKSLIRKFYKKN